MLCDRLLDIPQESKHVGIAENTLLLLTKYIKAAMHQLAKKVKIKK
jgi:hypothetical protein